MSDARQLTAPPGPGEVVRELAVDSIRPNPYQPRRTFDQEGLAELARSIEAAGVFQPIIVRRPDPNLNRYELIAGERRLRATRMTERKTIPAIVRVLDDQTMMEVAVLENLQREDLSPLEEAQAYQTLIERLNLTQAQVAARLGKSRPYIANYLRLLGLPEEVKQMLASGELSMGQARTLLGVKDERRLVELAKRVANEGLTVRQIEEIVAAINKKGRQKPVVKSANPYLREAESQLAGKLGTKVSFQAKRRGGKIVIPYGSNQDLNRILELLGVHFD
ncbi:ParB/RepB/Spo0J family partition protein [Limosilactobacillus fermentum]|uniref:ParB/RepB/Spo0J family partition protein n=1 Tax=Limosilactobacillus fermentum TaxID=1613 RepID=UPI0001DB50AF|nr:ParB/RepB/Spo0J family partition protein [Limosilactobacillus fermentum]ADJ40734.1 Stage 0 DNA-binding protein [Limosilactobacillus fermentum CECT 5716]ARA99930.1 chromosome partitioning protein ParB [Limosilactobacillus fermentum]MBC9022662.1 ParB/RepB/Spo0J family partition protein [Limosilactobacillus fermentum CECT 5716]MCB4716134.1 ParB/RepB/Spo0J family partition protein [Limosilactobacillus fermentum]MCH5387302.1 ParB/RepB/Spo0J family partition protein [Limosilactobacillus fermentum